LLAKAEQTDKNNDLMKARYLRYLPQAESYFTMHDFTFYTLHITQARYIAGFGKMGWVGAVDLQIPTYPLMVEEPGILEHMNKDHVANLTAYCLHYYQVVATSVEMIGIDSLGFDVRIWRTVNQTDEPQILRFVFKQTVTTAQEARVALVQMANACRS
jgi:putative heme iron utilization protein